MVAVLTWRVGGPSQFILYEISLALRARKPLVVFLDDRLPDSLIPALILQRRFSSRTYFRQVREHTHALRILKEYMGDRPISAQRRPTLMWFAGSGCNLCRPSKRDPGASAIFADPATAKTAASSNRAITNAAIISRSLPQLPFRYRTAAD
jgi:hypothetical protein